MIRLDTYLCEHGFFESRTKAREKILSNAVSVNGKTQTKPSFLLNGDETITIDSSNTEYVGRGGQKLKAAIDLFSLDVTNKICVDIGASTGGFTDCLLKHGAFHVFAIDCGSNQLHESLKTDTRVTNIENFNARYLTKDILKTECDLAVIDVSFISQTLLFDAIKTVTKPDGDVISLIKPQFELSKTALSKKGIVKDKKMRITALNKVCDFAKEAGFTLKNIAKSPILGGDGNIEYLALFSINKTQNPYTGTENTLTILEKFINNNDV